jgi:hypothetical protein
MNPEFIRIDTVIDTLWDALTMRFMSFVAETPYIRRRRLGIFLVFVSVLLVSCHSNNLPRPKPSVEVTRVPVANPGGPEQLDYIEGRVTGAGPDQQIVLYAHSGVWWIQPFRDTPFTKIQADSTWRNSTHLGTEYAALLVKPGYRPESKIATLPKEGNDVVAVATARGQSTVPILSKVVHFSGYDWIVRTAGSDRGGQPNSYDPANVWIDPKGYLHLRMAQLDGRWSCAEVNLTRSLGFGTYRFVVQDSAHLGSSAVLGMFTWDEARTDDTRSELDIELSRWGRPDSKNAQYVVQPFYVPENVARFTVPSGVLTHILQWEQGVASFKTVRGSEVDTTSKTISKHVFTSGVPNPAAETVHINLYDFHHSKGSLQLPAEVVIEKFEYLP